MGVPKFFRWVAERYPLVITPFQDSPPPVDNLYLDMNGIIHHCSHPNDVDASRKSLTEKEMVEAMFAYLEKIFQAIQPKKHFVLAVDGCAPRAKMNQQRQRRYRSGYELMVAREEALKRGEEIPEEGDVFDSNCITPGTEFMVRVGEQFKYFIAMKVQQDSAWRNCKIIYSGHDQPGEGEHKIVEFLRNRKMEPGYDPNETHCMYGLDADLIMLALATHEPNFILLREVVSFTQQSKKDKERAAEDEAKGIKESQAYGKPDTFVLFHIKLLREYLDKDVRRGQTFPNYDLERIIDDFVFMCFFIGNDFMPSIPTLAINDGSMLTMLEIYRDHVLAKGANLLRGGKPNWNAVDTFLAKLGELELETLRNRQDEELEYQKRRSKLDPSREAPIPSVPIASMAEYKEKFYRDKHGFANGWEPRGPELHSLKQHYIEGLMWVLEYYYQGPPSWKWFYPHHYAPMASDLVNLTSHAVNVQFDRGQPFLPHQQLLAVLPPMSYRSMPRAYWPLLRSANSPLVKYFPPHLEIDREGARAPWEGTVLIPFIDEKTLVLAYESVQSQLTEEDRRRNRPGPPVLFEYDADMEPYDLPNDMFTTLKSMRVRRTAFPMPERPPRFVPALCKGVRLGLQHIEGFGSLFSHDHEVSTTFETGAVSIFGMPSRKESLLVTFNEGEVQTADGIAGMVGQEVWVGFPHFKRARVCAVIDRHRRLSAKWDNEGNFSGLLSENLTGEMYRQFKKDTELHQQFLKSKCGIVIPSVDVLVYVNRFTGMRISRKGRFLHSFSKKDSCYPLQLVTQRNDIDMSEDQRNVERDRQAGDFDRVQQVIYMGPDPKTTDGEGIKGCIGYVLERGQDDFCTMLLRQYLKPQPVPQALLNASQVDNWMTLHDMTDRIRADLRIQITSSAVSQLCGSITTSAQWGSQELGLCIKFTTKNLARVGLAKLVAHQYNPWYVGNASVFEKMEGDGEEDVGHYMEAAKKEAASHGGKRAPPQTNPHDRGQWYFSQRAFDYVKEYCARFTPIIDRIVAGGHNNLAFDMATALTGKWAETDADCAMTQIVSWIEDSGLVDVPMISATDDAFAVQVVRELEQVLDQTTPRPVQEVKMKRVLSRHIHYPSAGVSGAVVSVPLQRDQRYALGNRVTYCRTTGIVPFGATGTIVRILGDGKSAEVVFDEPFIGGSHLGGRLKTTRGALCKLPALLVTSSSGAASSSAASSSAVSPNEQRKAPSIERAPDGTTTFVSASKAGMNFQDVDKALASTGAKAPAATQPGPAPTAEKPKQAERPAPEAPRVRVQRQWSRAPPKHTRQTIANSFMAAVRDAIAQK